MRKCTEVLTKIWRNLVESLVKLGRNFESRKSSHILLAMMFWKWLVIPIIPIFMIDLIRKSTIKKTELIKKSAKKDRFTYWSMIDHQFFIKLRSLLIVFFFIVKKNWKIDHRKMKRSIIYDRKSVIRYRLLKTDQSIMIENQFLIGITGNGSESSLARGSSGNPL